MRRELQISSEKEPSEASKAQSRALEVILVLTEQAGEERRDIRDRLSATEERADKATEWIADEKTTREKWGARGWILLSGVLVIVIAAMLVTWLVKK